MFTRLTEFKLSNDEYVTHPVVQITDQRKPRTVSAVVHDEQGERWLDFPFNFHNLYLIGKFQADESAWLESEAKRTAAGTKLHNKGKHMTTHNLIDQNGTAIECEVKGTPKVEIIDGKICISITTVPSFVVATNSQNLIALNLQGHASALEREILNQIAAPKSLNSSLSKHTTPSAHSK